MTHSLKTDVVKTIPRSC